LKCTQCGNENFAKTKGMEISGSYEAQLEVFDPISRFVCLNCGYILSFNFKLVDEYKSTLIVLNERKTEQVQVENEISKLSREYFLKIDPIKKEIDQLNDIIHDEDNSVRVINSSKQKAESLKGEIETITRKFDTDKAVLQNKLNSAREQVDEYLAIIESIMTNTERPIKQMRRTYNPTKRYSRHKK